MKTKIDSFYQKYLAGVNWAKVGALFAPTEGFFVYILSLTRLSADAVRLYAGIMAVMLILCLLLIPKGKIALALNLVHDAEKELATGTATLAIVAPGASAATAAKVAVDVLPCLDDVLSKAEDANLGTVDEATTAPAETFAQSQQKASDEQSPLPVVVSEVLEGAAPAVPNSLAQSAESDPLTEAAAIITAPVTRSVAVLPKTLSLDDLHIGK